MLIIFSKIQLLDLNILSLLTWFCFSQQTECTGISEGPHFVVPCVCFFCSRRKYISGYSFTAVNKHIPDQPFRKCLLSDTAIRRIKNAEGGLLLICLWLLWNALVLKQFSAVSILCISVAILVPVFTVMP